MSDLQFVQKDHSTKNDHSSALLSTWDNAFFRQTKSTQSYVEFYVLPSRVQNTRRGIFIFHKEYHRFFLIEREPKSSTKVSEKSPYSPLHTVQEQHVIAVTIIVVTILSFFCVVMFYHNNFFDCIAMLLSVHQGDWLKWWWWCCVPLLAKYLAKCYETMWTRRLPHVVMLHRHFTWLWCDATKLEILWYENNLW